jgi:hypothetical protein
MYPVQGHEDTSPMEELQLRALQGHAALLGLRDELPGPEKTRLREDERKAEQIKR